MAGTKKKDTQEDILAMTKEEIEAALNEAADNLEDDDSDFSTYESDPRRLSVKTLLKKFKDGELIIPPFQRLYVWNKTKQKLFFKTIEANLPTPSIIMAEYKKVLSLVDGFQRTTTLMLMTNSNDLSKKQKEMVKNYKVDTITVFNMLPQEQKKYFQLLNSGIPLAAIVKERSKLPEAISDTVLSISSNTFFTNTEIDRTATFNKSHHHEIIAMNTLLAVSGVEFGENKARALCKLLMKNEDVVMHNVDKAIALIAKIADIYKNLDSEKTKRSMNASFIGMLVRVLSDHNDVTDGQIINLINYIFAKTRAVKEYSQTTGNGSGDAGNCKARYDLLVRWLENPPSQEFDEVEFKKFCKKHKDANVKDSVGEYVIDFNTIDDDTRQALYMAEKAGKTDTYDNIIKNKYNGQNGQQTL